VTPTAVLFDIDGTLVDSNFLHIESWAHAFDDLGLTVPAWRIQRMIGADSDELLGRLIGDRPDGVKARAKDLHSENYERSTPRLNVFDGARELVAAIAARGARVVLATSAPRDELDRLLPVLDIEEHTHAVTSGEDVETAKPRPDIIEVALERAGVESSDAFMVGDSVWDIAAADRAGVRCIGVLSGGTGADDLRRAGAAAVYDDVAALLEGLETSPLAGLWA
jgi:HAD superfamily hydrolase (TIGR01509 family)